MLRAESNMPVRIWPAAFLTKIEMLWSVQSCPSVALWVVKALALALSVPESTVVSPKVIVAGGGGGCGGGGGGGGGAPLQSMLGFAGPENGADSAARGGATAVPPGTG